MIRGQLLVRILTTLENAVIAYVHNPGRSSLSFYRFLREFDELQDITDRELRQMTRYALARKYVVFNKGKKRILVLTQKGKEFLVRRILSFRKPHAWDTKWRIVLFDIPDKQKSARNSFAITLKRAGFARLQKSVFINPYPCEEELQALAEFLGISDCVDIVIADRITREGEYKKLFDLR